MRTSDDLKMVEIFDSQISTSGNTSLAKVAVQCYETRPNAKR